ncbi:large ribosomal subunit protein uL14m isoform X1 [Stigmatopora nigra]
MDLFCKLIFLRRGENFCAVMAMYQLTRSVTGILAETSYLISQRTFGVSAVAAAIQKMTRVRVVDNSSLGNTPYHRPPRVIHVYTKNGIGKVGDKVLLAIKGQKKPALIVGHKMPGARMQARFDSNNVVLIEDNGNPTGTRIKVPIPTHLREKIEGEYSKVLAIASSFV